MDSKAYIIFNKYLVIVQDLGRKVHLKVKLLVPKGNKSKKYGRTFKVNDKFRCVAKSIFECETNELFMFDDLIARISDTTYLYVGYYVCTFTPKSKLIWYDPAKDFDDTYNYAMDAYDNCYIPYYGKVIPNITKKLVESYTKDVTKIFWSYYDDNLYDNIQQNIIHE